MYLGKILQKPYLNKGTDSIAKCTVMLSDEKKVENKSKIVLLY